MASLTVYGRPMDHYIFILSFVMAALCIGGIIFLPCDFYLSIFFFLAYLSGRRLDVYHTLTHGVALGLVRI